MRVVRYWSVALAAVICSLGPAMACAQDVGPQVPLGGYNVGDFRFGGDARVSLQVLWRSSSDAKAERVACIGGYRSGGITYITRVTEVYTSADSMNASAQASLRECRPPEWLGTVHTHIAQLNGQPYSTFSGADRGVMWEWHTRWRADGVFCILYTERHAYCEAGEDSSGDTVYANERGNAIVR